MPLSAGTTPAPGPLESVLAARQAVLPALAPSLSAPATQGQGIAAVMPSASQQALLRALLKSISKHRLAGAAPF